MSRALDDIARERRRQIEIEGWTPDHDDTHHTGELARAAACYAAGGGLFKVSSLQVPKQVWPYRWEWNPSDRRRDLVKAGALIVAEIERLDRRAALSADASKPSASPTGGEVELAKIETDLLSIVHEEDEDLRDRAGRDLLNAIRKALTAPRADADPAVRDAALEEAAGIVESQACRFGCAFGSNKDLLAAAIRALMTSTHQGGAKPDGGRE